MRYKALSFNTHCFVRLIIMAKLTISGSGKWINVNPLDEMTAKKYAETVVLTRSEYSTCEMNSQAYAEGFYPSANVYLNDQHMGTVDQLLASGKHYEEYHTLQEALANSSDISTIKNAWVREHDYKGNFVAADIADDYTADETAVSANFIRDFIKNLRVTSLGLFDMMEWNGNRYGFYAIESPSKWDDTYILYQGQRHEFVVEED